METFVELKAKHCFLKFHNELDREVLKHHQNSSGFDRRSIFNFKSQWDYIFTTIADRSSETQQSRVMFAPRDLIPPSWWNVPVIDEPVVLEWPIHHNVAPASFILNMSDREELVKGMLAILHKYGSQAQKPVPPPDPASILQGQGTPSKRSSRPPEDIPVTRGMTYQMKAYQSLIQVCRK